MKAKQTDVAVDACSSIAMVTPLTQRGRTWVAKHVHSESWQWQGLSLAVDYRYAGDLVAGMRRAGLRVEA